MASVPLPPYIYEWVDENGASLYVGKASNVGKRIDDHFRDRRSHALAARTIRLTPVYGCSNADDPMVDELEQARIKERRPKANIAHNGRHHDGLWELRVQRAYRTRMGVPHPPGERFRLWLRVAASWLRQWLLRVFVAVGAVTLGLLVTWLFVLVALNLV